MSSPSGGGAMRGVHNCGACDQKALDAIESFSFSQNIDDLDVKCDCISKWENYRVSEQILGSPADLDRDFENELVLRK
jgi:radical SAM enzyme (TIGR01210 family)